MGDKKDVAYQLLKELYEKGEFYNSAIELEHTGIEGVEFYKRLKNLYGDNPKHLENIEAEKWEYEATKLYTALARLVEEMENLQDQFVESQMNAMDYARDAKAQMEAKIYPKEHDEPPRHPQIGNAPNYRTF